MKRFGKILAVLVAAVVLLGGCTLKEEFKFKIKEDKNVELSLVMAYDKEMIDGLISMNDSDISKDDITDEMRWAYLEKQNKDQSETDGVKLEKYTQDGWYGYIVTKNIGSIDDLSTEDKNASRVSISADDLDKAKIFIKDGDKYKSNLFVDKNEDDFKQMDSYKSYGAVFNVTMTVDLPNKAISNNATEVTNDGKTLSWNLLETENIDFEFQFKKGGVSKTLVTIIAIVVVVIILLVAIVVVIIVAVSAGKKNKTVEAPKA